MIVIPECLYRGSSFFSHLESGFPIRNASGMTVLGLLQEAPIIELFSYLTICNLSLE